MFAPYGRGVFAEPQRGSAPSADGGDVAAPAAVGKRVDTYGFYPLNSRFPLFLSLAKIGERRPLRNRGTAENLFYRRAHIVRLFSVLHKQNYVPMAIFHKQGTTNFVKNRLCGKILFSV